MGKLLLYTGQVHLLCPLGKWIFFNCGLEEDPATSIQLHSPSITSPEPDPVTTLTADKEPEPTADREPSLPTTDITPEAKPTTERVPAAESISEEMPEVPSSQGCEPAITSVPVGVLVEMDKEEWLIDWITEVVLPPLHTQEPSLSLVLSCTNVSLTPLVLSRTVLSLSPPCLSPSLSPHLTFLSSSP